MSPLIKLTFPVWSVVSGQMRKTFVNRPGRVAGYAITLAYSWTYYTIISIFFVTSDFSSLPLLSPLSISKNKRLNSPNPTHFHNITTAPRKCVFFLPRQRKNKAFNEPTLNFLPNRTPGVILAEHMFLMYKLKRHLPPHPFYFISTVVLILRSTWNYLETKHITFM